MLSKNKTLEIFKKIFYKIKKPNRTTLYNNSVKEVNNLKNKNTHVNKRNHLVIYFISIAITILIIFSTGVNSVLWQDVKDIALTLTSPLFKVKDVQVLGRKETTTSEILTALGTRWDTPFFNVSLKQAKARLEQLPWVKSVNIARKLPDTIIVNIKEKIPRAIWQHEGNFDLVDRDGDLIIDLKGDVKKYGDLPLIVGEGAPEHIVSLLDILKTNANISKHIYAAVMVQSRRWNILTKEDTEIKLPELNIIDAYHTLGNLDRKYNLLNKHVSIIDLRFNDRILVRLNKK